MDVIYNYLHIFAVHVSNLFQINIEQIPILVQNAYFQVLIPTLWALWQALLMMKTCAVTLITIVLPIARGFTLQLLRHLRHERLMSILNGMQWVYCGLAFFYQENGYEVVLKAIIYHLVFTLIMTSLRAFWAIIHQGGRMIRHLIQQMGFWGNTVHHRARSPRRRGWNLVGVRLRWRMLSPPVPGAQPFQVNQVEPNLLLFPVIPAEPHFPNYNIWQRLQRDLREREQREQQPPPRQQQQQPHLPQPDTFRQRLPHAYPITSHTFQVAHIRLGERASRYYRIQTTRMPMNSRVLGRVQRRQAVQSPRQALDQQITNACIVSSLLFLIYCAYLYFQVTE